MSLAPLSLFEIANQAAGQDLYEIHLLSDRGGGRVSNSFGMDVSTQRLGEKDFDTIFVGSASRISPATPLTLNFLLPLPSSGEHARDNRMDACRQMIAKSCPSDKRVSKRPSPSGSPSSQEASKDGRSGRSSSRSSSRVEIPLRVSEDPVVVEIRSWFFDQYLSKWVSIGASKDGDPRAILQYWGVPMHASSPNMNRWLMTDDDVLSLLSANQKPLQASNYTQTEVLDSAITAFNSQSGSVDAIWSRRRQDESEIERRAVHFEVRRTELGWRIIALASQLTDRDRLAEVWRTGGANAPVSDEGGAGPEAG
jgi:hypothetical protein